MPKYTNPGAEEAFQEKAAENAAMRRSICAELVWDVLPEPREEPIPRAELFDRAVAAYKRDGFAETEPFLEDHSDSFITAGFMRRHSAEIDAANRDELHFVEAIPFVGVRKANKAGLRETAAWRLQCAQGTVGAYNDLAEDARLAHVEVPLLTMKLLPAPKD